MIQKTWRGFCERRNYRRVSNVSKVSFLKKKNVLCCVPSTLSKKDSVENCN